MFIRIVILALLAPLLFATATLAASYQEQRQTMLQRDIAGRGIRDPQVLAAMAKIPRHLFVAERYRHEAYATLSPSTRGRPSPSRTSSP